MLSRPEEVDAASGIGPVFSPFTNRDIDITMDVIRAVFLNDSVTDNNAHWFSAVQARSVDPDCFSREDPAYCQGFEASLRKPLLLTVDSNAVLRGQVVKRRK